MSGARMRPARLLFTSRVRGGWTRGSNTLVAYEPSVEAAHDLGDVPGDQPGLEEREVMHRLDHEGVLREGVAEHVALEMACEESLGGGGLLVREHQPHARDALCGGAVPVGQWVAR